jgi:hypothetical protein
LAVPANQLAAVLHPPHGQSQSLGEERRAHESAVAAEQRESRCQDDKIGGSERHEQALKVGATIDPLFTRLAIRLNT